VPGSGAYFAGNEFAKRLMIPAGGSVADLGPAQLLLAGGTAGASNRVFSNTPLVFVRARALVVVANLFYSFDIC
jgi:hypothetical protein